MLLSGVFSEVRIMKMKTNKEEINPVAGAKVSCDWNMFQHFPAVHPPTSMGHFVDEFNEQRQHLNIYNQISMTESTRATRAKMPKIDSFVASVSSPRPCSLLARVGELFCGPPPPNNVVAV